MWDQGQQRLAEGRYVAARTDLEAAEKLAWRRREAGALARMYLPLLEVRRQIRYLAVEGKIVIGAPSNSVVRECSNAPAGTMLIEARAGDAFKALQLAERTRMDARRGGRCLESLLLVHRGNESRLTSPADPLFAAGIPVAWSPDGSGTIADSTNTDFIAPLPPAGVYDRQTAGAGERARESLLMAWEALGLKWQRRHPFVVRRGGTSPTEAAWRELEWLRQGLRIDPASEPISMRLISLAESIARLA